MMGIREKLNEKQNFTITAASLVILLAIGFIIYSSFAAKEQPPVIPDKAWFTTDDGATWFIDDINKAPPFKTSDGKMAVRAYVFKCGDGKPFVGYLQRYSAAAKRMIDGQPSSNAGDDGSADEGQEDAEDAAPGYGSSARGGASGAAVLLSGVQLKKPGERQWVSTQDPASALVRMVACPDGKPGTPEAVAPITEQP